MPNIVDLSYFQKANIFNIPLAVEMPIANPALATPNESGYLTYMIAKIENNLLLNALGLDCYNELQLALADIDNPLYASYKKLVEGEDYDGKVWNGLAYDLGFITAKVYEDFLTQTNERLSGVGNVKVNPEKATNLTPAYKIANASQIFKQNYQGGYLIEPIVIDCFVDWYGQNNDVEVSFYKYMLDKTEDFPLFDITKFRIYTEDTFKNSFGI